MYSENNIIRNCNKKFKHRTPNFSPYFSNLKAYITQFDNILSNSQLVFVKKEHIHLANTDPRVYITLINFSLPLPYPISFIEI